MTLVYWLFGAGFFLPLSSIGLDLFLDSRDMRPWLVRQQPGPSREELEIARLTAPLPPARQSLEPLPERQSPMDLPARHDTAGLAAVVKQTRLRSAMFVPAPAPIAVEVGETGRHHIGVAPGTAQQQERWNSPTGQFWLIVGDLDDPCTHCSDPEEGEPAHAGCPGCSCPCGSPRDEVDTAPNRPLPIRVEDISDEKFAEAMSG